MPADLPSLPHSRPPAFTDPPDGPRYRRVMEAFTGIPGTDGNRVTVLRNGDEIFPAMLEAVARARRTIDFMTYIYWRGDVARRFADTLAERAQVGVRVRVLLDAFGTRPMEGGLIQRMRRAGVLVERFRRLDGSKPWNVNMRTHRRVLVCDEEVAFTGGVGIAAQWEGDAEGPGRWRDTHFRVEGPAVDGVHAAFTADWLEMDQAVLSAADAFPERHAVGDTAVQVVRAASEPGLNDAALALAGLLALARDRIRITSAYLRPPGHFIDLLCAAVDRGVQVDVLVPGPHTEPAFYRWAAEYHYEQLLRRGVRVWVYQPTMHHAKVVTVDGLVAMVGTTNFDARSLAMNEQVAMVLHDAGVTATLDEHFAEDCRRSERLEPVVWASRGARQRVREATAHVVTFGLRGAGASRRDSVLSWRDGS